jgi:hypothetical protein
MKTITTLYGERGTAYWIAGFTVANIIIAILSMIQFGWIGRAGIVTGLVLLTIANVVILKYQTQGACLKVPPLFHITMLICAGSIVLNSAL